MIGKISIQDNGRMKRAGLDKIGPKISTSPSVKNVNPSICLSSNVLGVAVGVMPLLLPVVIVSVKVNRTKNSSTNDDAKRMTIEIIKRSNILLDSKIRNKPNRRTKRTSSSRERSRTSSESTTKDSRRNRETEERNSHANREKRNSGKQMEGRTNSRRTNLRKEMQRDSSSNLKSSMISRSYKECCIQWIRITFVVKEIQL